MDGQHKQTFELSRGRLLAVLSLFAVAFVLIGARLVGLAAFSGPVGGRQASVDSGLPVAGAARGQTRADIVDRNGIILATDLTVMSAYADPRRILDAPDAARRLAAVMTDIDVAAMARRLASKKHFVWVRRKLDPGLYKAVNDLGIPGIEFISENRRVYPQGRLAAHAVGFVDLDNRGLAGLERRFDGPLSAEASGPGFVTALDIRVQHAVHDVLSAGLQRFHARAAIGLVADVDSGAILAIVSLPDFDPAKAGQASRAALFNHASLGVYEMGSTFKTFTVAMALEDGVASLSSRYDASRPLHVARFTIRDDHPLGRVLTVPEIYIHSSNIGSARMALDVGAPAQREFLDKIGLLRPAAIELPEVGRPLLPARWRDIRLMTISYGHGLAVSPVQLISAISAMVNGGIWRPASLLVRGGATVPGQRVISPRTSDSIRQLMRSAVLEGTGHQARAIGYRVGGKTGTAEKSVNGGYSDSADFSSFVGAFPMEAPRYAVFVAYDEPQGDAATSGFSGGGWTAAPGFREIVRRIAPIVGVRPGQMPTGARRASFSAAAR